MIKFSIRLGHPAKSELSSTFTLQFVGDVLRKPVTADIQTCKPPETSFKSMFPSTLNMESSRSSQLPCVAPRVTLDPNAYADPYADQWHRAWVPKATPWTWRGPSTDPWSSPVPSWARMLMRTLCGSAAQSPGPQADSWGTRPLGP